jgi:hypothetical protein
LGSLWISGSSRVLRSAFETDLTKEGLVTVGCDPIDALDAEADWTGRDVTVSELRSLLLKHAEARRIVVRGVRVLSDGSDEGGSLDLTDQRLDAAVVLRDCRVEAALVLDYAVIGRLEVVGSQLPAGIRLKGGRIRKGMRIAERSRVGSADGVSVDGFHATIEGSLVVEGEGTHLRGGVSLESATVDGQFAIVDGAVVDAHPETGRSVDADALTIGGALYVYGDNTRLEGGMRLVDASVGSQLVVARGAQIATNKGSNLSIDADGLRVRQILHVVGDKGTRLWGGLRLVGASVGGQIAIHKGARLDSDPTSGLSIDGDGLSITGDLLIAGRGTRLEGGLDLAGAKVGRRFWIKDGAEVSIDPKSGLSVDADGLTVAGDLFVDREGPRLEGGLRLQGASIGGQFVIGDGAKVATDPKAGSSIDADGLTVTGGLFIDGEDTRLEGWLDLGGASIGNQFVIGEGAKIAADPESGLSVDADGLTVTGDLFIDGEGTRLEGGLRLQGASISGRFELRDGAEVARNVDLWGANLARLQVKSGVIIGVLDLSHARVGRLDDVPKGWEFVGGYRLAGITIDALASTLADRTDWPVKERIGWLKQDESPSRRPFTQVAELYRQAGHRENARKVAIAGERATSNFRRKVWSDLTVGYGYRPWLAGAVAVVLILVSYVAVVQFGDVFVPVDRNSEAQCPDDYPCLNRGQYIAETVVPVGVEFGQRDAWRIDPNSPYATLLQYGQFLLDASGLILALLLVGAVTGLVRRE